MRVTQERNRFAVLSWNALWASLSLLPLLSAPPALGAAQGAETETSPRDDDERQDLDSIVVTATRSGQLVRDQPIRVEVVPDAEIEENLTVAPGNLTNLLNELAGVRMQSASPGLGGTALQLRGLAGRYALILYDGLPLSGAQSDSFSLMQTTPLDLGRAEVLKGVASALYGSSALAGVLNLVSRAPEGESEVLLNRTSVGGTDAVGFWSGTPAKTWGYTLTGGAHGQSREDPDHDGWSDIPTYTRFTLRPRLFWNGGSDRTVFATLGIVDEDREGGTMPGRTLANGLAFLEALHTRRVDGGAVARFGIGDGRTLSTRWSANVTKHDQQFGALRVQDTQETVLGEATVNGELQSHKWTLGAAIQYERLHTSDVAGVSYDYTVPGVFAQDEFAVTRWLSVAASARVDDQSDYGTFFSPRVSVLVRPGADWSLRASIGTGFAAPTPLVDEVQARSLGVLTPLRGLRAERASSTSLDAKWAANSWDVNVSAFASEIRNPLTVRTAAEPDRLDLINGEGPLRARGAELLIGYAEGAVHLLINSTLLDVTEVGAGEVRHRADRVPRFSAEIAGILEDEERGRLGLEISYTGRQSLEDNPYRDVSRSYVEVNALAEWRVGRAAIFLNALNLTNVRQSEFDPLLRPAPGPGGDPITDAWAPLIGRTFNLGVRLRL